VVSLEIYSDQISLGKIRQSDLVVTADLVKAGLGLQQVAVTVVLNRSDVGYVKIVANPPVIDVRIDEQRSVVLPVTIRAQRSDMVDITSEEPQIDFVEGGVRTVTISGPAALVEKVQNAAADVVVRPVSASYRTSAEVVVADASGREVSGVEISPQAVDLQITIRSKVGIKEVVILPQVAGYVAAGYRIEEVQVAPQTVSISGGSDVVEQTNSIRTAPLDVSGVSESITRTVRLQIEPNISFLNNPRGEVQVVVRVVPVSEAVRVRLPVAVQLSEIPEGRQFVVNPAIVELDVVISPNAMQRSSLGAFVAVVPVGAWDVAAPFREVQLQLPGGVQLLSAVPVVQLSETTVLTTALESAAVVPEGTPETTDESTN
jgi:YbbR domain-containing protein